MDMGSIARKTVVVTGGAGFIGSHLSDKLITFGPAKIIVIDNLSLGKKRNIEHLLVRDSRVKMYVQDASDYERMTKIFEKERVDVVFNLAVVPLPFSLKKPKEAIDKNTLITTTMCELLRRKCYKTLIHCSSSECYGTASYVPMDEDHPTKPRTPYAASKTACDHIVMSYRRTFGVDVAIARPFNTYGPRQNDRSYAAVIPITIRRILTGKPPIIYGDGLQTRDFTYVEDIADTMTKVYEVGSTRGRIVNIASGREISIKDLIGLISNLTNYEGEVTYADPGPGDVRRHMGEISLARKLLGYSPKTNYELGLKKTIDWYRVWLGE